MSLLSKCSIKRIEGIKGEFENNIKKRNAHKQLVKLIVVYLKNAIGIEQLSYNLSQFIRNKYLVGIKPFPIKRGGFLLLLIQFRLSHSHHPFSNQLFCKALPNQIKTFLQ